MRATHQLSQEGGVLARAVGLHGRLDDQRHCVVVGLVRHVQKQGYQSERVYASKSSVEPRSACTAPLAPLVLTSRRELEGGLFVPVYG